MTQEVLLIHELAEKAGVTVRTIRYYIEQGLLPEPKYQGRYSYYTPSFLDRLELIRRLKDSFLPLSEIREIMTSLTDAEVRRRLRMPPSSPKLSSQPPPPPSAARPSARALEYIDQVMDSQAKYRTKGTSEKTPQDYYREKELSNEPQARQPEQSSESSEETWQHIAFASGVELHIRKPMDPKTENRVQQLINFARRIFHLKP